MTASLVPADEAAAEPAAGVPAKLPKYYQVKRQLLEFTATLDPGSPVPPEIGRASCRERVSKQV